MKLIEIDKVKLKRLLDSDIPMNDIAKLLETSKNVVYNRMKLWGIKPVRKPGYYITGGGYKMILSPKHPYKNKMGYVREHRLVMENKLNRYLLPTEHIDHINENKLDNRIENLRLATQAENNRYYQANHGNPFSGKKHTAQIIAIIKEKRKLQVGINHPMYGKHHSEETKQKISETKRRQYAT